MQEGNSPRSISVVVPVLDEPRLPELVRHVRDVAGSVPVQIIVVDGDPAGASLVALRESVSDDADADLLLLTASPGRARQMNAGAARADGDILVFLHADTRLPAGAFEAVLLALGTGLARAGAFDLDFDADRTALKLVARVGSIRSRLERIPYGDQVHFLDAAYFRELDGYPDVPIMEDVELFRAIRHRGDGCVILPDRASTSPRRYERDGIARRVTGNWLLRLSHALGISHRRLAARYEAHTDRKVYHSKPTEITTMKNDACVILFMKYPEPGTVKTRIAAEIGPEAAADLARAFVEDTLDMLRWVEDADVIVCYAPKEREEDMKAWLGDGYHYTAQKGANLGIRMRNAFRVAYIFKKYERVVLLGADVPHLHDDVVRKGLESLGRSRAACIAPAEDGGYYLIGFEESGFEPRVLEQVDYEDRETVYAQTFSRLQFYDKKNTVLDFARDIDTLEDLRVLFEGGAFKPSSATYKVAKRILG